MRRAFAFVVSSALAAFGAARAQAATLVPHPDVQGPGIEVADLRPAGGAWRSVAWADLGRSPLAVGRYEVRVRFSGAGAVQVPPCAGRRSIRVDGRTVTPGAAPAGPVVVPVVSGDHEAVITLDVGKYERRVACGEPVRAGVSRVTTEGLGEMTFDSPHAAQGGGRAVVYVPGTDVTGADAVLVGLHPWNGTPWTYAAYDELLREARARGVLLLMPSGLGNSLYTADAEDEVLRAIDALASLRPDRPLRVSLWGASMGGAGATTIGFHHPDRFLTLTSFFGDSQYDLATYVRAILRDPAAAHAVNALDVADNARNLPVWLIHGEDDATSPIRQSELLATALHQRGFAVRFDRVPGFGHAGALVARFLPELVARAAAANAVVPARVTYWSVRASDVEAYGVRVDRASAQGDAFVDVERRPDGVHVLRADGARSVTLVPGALGAVADAPIVVDARPPVPASWARAR
jgi:enterochelin esterase-like enzyme